MRVEVPFGRGSHKVGIIVGTSPTSDIKQTRLKRILKLLDEEPLFDEKHLNLLKWASNYYHYPLGEIIFASLPSLIRQGKPLKIKSEYIWKLTELGKNFDEKKLSRAKKQLALFQFFKLQSNGAKTDYLNQQFDEWRNGLKGLMDKGIVEKVPSTHRPLDDASYQEINFSDEQQHAFNQIKSKLNSNSRILIDGITGSGKTEIYLEVIKEIISRGQQVIVLVPEIGLTPQFISRIKQRLPSSLVVIHSGLSDGERLQAWIQARSGEARVILGTRSAIWTPLKDPGLFVIDEEHDQSYKQQESFRYSARDIAILRADQAKIPIILGTATPSLETLHNVEKNKLVRITLSKRAENAILPQFSIVDMRAQTITGALSDSLIKSIKDVLNRNKQVLLFQNRRGYSPVFMCHECGWTHKCKRCDLAMTFHKSINRMICHHCSSQAKPSPTCPECESKEIIQIGHGTERLNETLKECFPSARILRIDRDSTRRKGSMENYMERINSGEIDILVGTQMLAKGHHFPGVTLVGIIDADRGLYSSDFRASERMAQLIIQVSGRAGRANDPGLVIVQTHFPEHPLLMSLMKNSYNTFAHILLNERKVASLPPYAYQALLRAEDYDENKPKVFLEGAADLLRKSSHGVDIFGPFPAPIEKKAGKYRYQLLTQSSQRAVLQKALHTWVDQIDNIKNSKKIRWSLDVDPQDVL
jgi:primosomal protein N' (replication factor Y)